MDVSEFIPKVMEALEKKGERKFSQSLEVIFNFTGASMEGEHKLNLSVVLPKGRGKDVRIGFFADGDMAVRAKKLTKDVLTKNEFEDYSKDRRKMRTYANKCYGFIAQADLMAQVGKNWGIVLGPRGKMPTPIPGNANLDAIFERMKSTVRVKSKKLPTVHVPIGVESMSAEDLAENILAVYIAVERIVPKDLISSLYVKSTMGEAVRIW